MRDWTQEQLPEGAQPVTVADAAPRGGSILRSRKFWAAVVGLLVALGVLNIGEAQQVNLVEAIVTVATTVAYIIGTAVEDGLRGSKG